MDRSQMSPVECCTIRRYAPGKTAAKGVREGGQTAFLRALPEMASGTASAYRGRTASIGWHCLLHESGSSRKLGSVKEESRRNLSLARGSDALRRLNRLA